MGLVARLREWSAIQKVRPFEEAPDLVGGRDAEALLGQLVGSSYHFKGAQVFGGRRIPSAKQGRRREIDLIVCTTRAIYLIEVKNWSGRLDLRGHSWRQTRRGGDVVDHGDLLESNLLKRDAVVEYLAARGLTLDDSLIREHIVPKIIFMNPRLDLDPAIEARSEVISRRSLDAYLNQPRPQSFAEQIFSSVVDFFLNLESGSQGQPSTARTSPIPRHEFKTIVSLLSETGTWDRLHYFGTRVVTGDLIGIVAGPERLSKSEVAERSKGRPIRLRWTRGRLWGLFKAMTGVGSLGTLNLGIHRIRLSTHDTLTFHVVGEKTPTEVRLVDLDRVSLG
ncbi:nuclease-related domain-containing protein [Singulisphaera rosea]